MPAQFDVSPLNGFLWPLAVTLSVTIATVPIVRNIAVKLHLYDVPDSGLKPHQRPIPYLGGVAMFFGWLAGLAWALPISNLAHAPLHWIAPCGAILMLTGLIDDIRHLPPKTRLVIQALVAAALVHGGVGHDISTSLLSPLRSELPAWLFGNALTFALSWAICAFVIAGATNSTNLIDGLDGLCAGVLAIASIGFLAINLRLSHDAVALNSISTIRTALCIALLGACLGFLVYNFNPATIFMGDSGSLVLGYNAALILILIAQHGNLKCLAGALMVFGFPIFDTALAITRRALNGRPLFVGDRSHFYDQLRDRGYSVKRTVLICYLISAALAITGVVLITLPTLFAIIIVVLSPLLALLLCWRQGMLRVDDAARHSQAPPHP